MLMSMTDHLHSPERQTERGGERETERERGRGEGERGRGGKRERGGGRMEG